MRNALKIKRGHKTGVAWTCRVGEKLGKFTKTAILILGNDIQSGTQEDMEQK